VEIVRGRAENAPAERRGSTFTGEVWADPVLSTVDGTTINSVFFTPGARTYWHYHEHGQLLHVTSGSGLICSSGGSPHVLGVGDTVWVPAGERHWHGATATTCMGHLAVSFGTTAWEQPVTSDEYQVPAARRLVSVP
jgi:quercetin dioxygenase-like cupin family protein